MSRYVVPRMADLGEASADAPTVASLFTGAGGSCLGFRFAGFRVAAATEFIESARDTYKLNFPDVPVLADDVRHVTGDTLRTAANLRGLDVLEGSPPCAAYSMAGRRQHGWSQMRRYSETRQRVDDLFAEFVRLLTELRPRAFVAENVPGFTTGAAVGEYNATAAGMRAAGYDVQAGTVDANLLGVPQRRKRLIFVGVRDDLYDPRRHVTAADAFPKPRGPRLTIGDALRTLPSPDADELRDREGASIVGLPVHDDWIALGEGHEPRYFNSARPLLSEPAPTVTVASASIGAAGVYHPTEPRKLTPRELKAITSFPDDFRLTGTFQQRYERIARAVPPLMMREIAAGVRAVLERATARDDT